MNKLYLCPFCKIAFTQSKSILHRKDKHPEIPKFRRLFDVIEIDQNRQLIDKSKIEETNYNIKIHNPQSKDLTKSKADNDIALSKKQDEEEKKTRTFINKRKLDEKIDDYEKPHIFRCNLCRLNFVSARIIEFHIRNECQMSSANITICDVCGLEFTKDELMTHRVKHHENHKFNQFYILSISNVNLVGNNVGLSTPKKITDSSQVELESKKNENNLSKDVSTIKKSKINQLNIGTVDGLNIDNETEATQGEPNKNGSSQHVIDQSKNKVSFKSRDIEAISHVINSTDEDIAIPNKPHMVENRNKRRKHNDYVEDGNIMRIIDSDEDDGNVELTTNRKHTKQHNHISSFDDASNSSEMTMILEKKEVWHAVIPEDFIFPDNGIIELDPSYDGSKRKTR